MERRPLSHPLSKLKGLEDRDSLFASNPIVSPISANSCVLPSYITPTMPMKTGRLTPALRVLTALVTVWCLGCSSFEVMIGALSGSAATGSMMTCDPGNSVQAALDQSTTTTPAIQSSSSTARSAYDCGCQSCHAPSPLLQTPTTLASTVAWPANIFSSRPTSVEPEPLIPPPQRNA